MKAANLDLLEVLANDSVFPNCYDYSTVMDQLREKYESSKNPVLQHIINTMEKFSEDEKGEVKAVNDLMTETVEKYGITPEKMRELLLETQMAKDFIAKMETLAKDGDYARKTNEICKQRRMLKKEPKTEL